MTNVFGEKAAYGVLPKREITGNSRRQRACGVSNDLASIPASSVRVDIALSGSLRQHNIVQINCPSAFTGQKNATGIHPRTSTPHILVICPH